MNFTCLSKGGGSHFPPQHILNVSGFRILLDCPLDLSALTMFSPVPNDLYHIPDEETHCCSTRDSLYAEVEMQKRQNIEKSLDEKSLIRAEPWYKTAKNLRLWDPSSIDVVLISSVAGMFGLPFLTKSKGFSAKIYVTEATARLGKLMMEDLISMHAEFKQFYGYEESSCPQWMKQEELELLRHALTEVVAGKDGMNLGEWMPLYSSTDVQDCIQKVQTLRYAEAACYNGMLVIKPSSSGSGIGSCNWSISTPEGNIACLSGSTFVSAHAMEFDYRALQGSDLLLYSDFIEPDVIEDIELDNYSAEATNTFPKLSVDDKNPKELIESLLNNDEISDQRDKIIFICSCIIESVKDGGSVLIPLDHLEISLQLLDHISIYLESAALQVPIYIISSVASEILAYINTIPEWLCKQQQEKMFSGKPLFSHNELINGDKLHVFPALHSPELLNNWQEPCIIISSHWSLRLGPIVHLLQRWSGDPHSLLVLEDGLDVDMALLPFKPLAMKVLQCSFHSGIRWQKAEALLQTLQPKLSLLPEGTKQHIRVSHSNSDSSSVFFYSESDTLDLPKLKNHLNLEISAELATHFRWKKLELNSMNITRLGGQFLLDHGKHSLLSGAKVDTSSHGRILFHWGSPDMEKLKVLLSKVGIDGTIEHNSTGTESEYSAVLRVHHPNKALIGVQGTSTIISGADNVLVARIFDTIGTILDGI